MQTTKFLMETGWKLILTDLNVSMSNLLKTASLPADLFSRNGISLTTEEYFRLWNSLTKISNDPMLPLRIGEKISGESFHPLFFAALNSPNLYVAMERISQYKKLVGPMKLSVTSKNKSTKVELDCLYKEHPLPDSLMAMELVFLVHLVRLATRMQIKPMRISTTSQIILQNNLHYAEYFGVEAKKSTGNSLVFSAKDSKQPFLTENKKMWEFFEPNLKKQLDDMNLSVSEKVHAALSELLPSGRSSIEDVADKLFINKRTLQRYLKNENTNFQKELSKTRENLAVHYLTHSSLPNEQISFLLGFEDPTSFARAFRKWKSTTPLQFRELHS